MLSKDTVDPIDVVTNVDLVKRFRQICPLLTDALLDPENYDGKGRPIISQLARRSGHRRATVLTLMRSMKEVAIAKEEEL